MANKVITFTLGAEGVVTPSTEQKAGVQGSHNVTEVRFDVSTIGADDNLKYRIQFIDGAGGFYSTGFLDEVTEGDKRYVSTMLPDDVTNAGGLAFAYLVVSKIVGETEDKVRVSDGGKLRFGFAGVGSPSEYAYRTRISNALVNAEIFVGQAEGFSEQAKGYKENAEGAASSASASASSASASASSASQSASDAAESLEDLENKIASGAFKGEPGPQGPQGAQGVQGEKGEPGETPDLTNYIRYWKTATEYKEEDLVLFEYPSNSGDNQNSANVLFIYECIQDHASTDWNQDNSYWNRKEITVSGSTKDGLGRYIISTYATKEELGNIEAALDNIIAIQNQLIGGGSV